jgi:hypothetical protein
MFLVGILLLWRQGHHVQTGSVLRKDPKLNSLSPYPSSWGIRCRSFKLVSAMEESDFGQRQCYLEYLSH